jgi:hypothetical protein
MNLVRIHTRGTIARTEKSLSLNLEPTLLPLPCSLLVLPTFAEVST